MTALNLHYTRSGSGPTLIIVHGLFGAADNWRSQVKQFAEHFDVIAVDLRNHGHSPKSDQHNYDLMATDLLALMDQLGIQSADILGHSMGGKAVMNLALHHPERVKKLIIADVAPVQYPDHHRTIFNALFSVDLTNLKSRSEADALLATQIDSPAIRAFLLKNLQRDKEGHFQWQMNLDVLSDQYANISAPPLSEAERQAHTLQFTGNTLFIKGAESDYILPEYQDEIEALFPHARYKIMGGCGHWVHSQKPVVFNKLVTDFLTAPSS